MTRRRRHTGAYGIAKSNLFGRTATAVNPAEEEDADEKSAALAQGVHDRLPGRIRAARPAAQNAEVRGRLPPGAADAWKAGVPNGAGVRCDASASPARAQMLSD